MGVAVAVANEYAFGKQQGIVITSIRLLAWGNMLINKMMAVLLCVPGSIVMCQTGSCSCP